MTGAALLLTALLFGGMALYSGGFAAFLFTALPSETAGPLLRRAFPHFYLFCIATAAVAAPTAWAADPLSALLLVAIAVTAGLAREVLMPAINAATDAGDKRRFGTLHGLSVALTLGHIVVAGIVLIRLASSLPPLPAFRP